MARKYAGILGPLAFSTLLLRNAFDGGSVETTLTLATVCLFVFAALGYLTGRIAETIVDETVKARLEADLKARDVRASAKR